MSRSFRTMREGREALRRAREAAGMSNNYTIDDAVVKEKPMSQNQNQEPLSSEAMPQVEEKSNAQATQQANPKPQPEVVEILEKQDPRLVEGEIALQRARIRRENAAMVQSCAMAVFAGLSAVAVGIGLYQSKHKPAAPAPAPAVK